MATSKQPVYAKPAEPVGPGLKPTYSSYIKQREYAILGYVKEPNQPGATTLPVEDEDIEAEIESTHVRIVRFEPNAYAKWLRDQKLHKPVAWENNPEAYRKIFNLIRQTLRLDDQMRTKRLKSKTIETLKLNDSDKAYLTYHWKGGVVREHADFQAMPDSQRSKRFSALKARIWDATDGIDLTIPYSVQSKQLSSDLSDRLVFSRLFKVPEHLEPYVFSPVSARVALKQLRAIVNGVLESRPDSVPEVPTFTVYRGPLPAPVKRTARQVSVNQASVKPRRSSGIGTAPLQKDEDFE
jgi:hypothetical protein